MSSLTALSYLFRFIEPSKVFVFVRLPPADLACFAYFYSSYAIRRLFLLTAPFWRVTKH